MRFLRARFPLGLLMFATASCGDEVRPEKKEPVPPPQIVEPAKIPTDALVVRSRPLMGTVFQISVAGASEPEAARAIDEAFREIERLEDLLSEWRPDSEISRINAAAGKQPVVVSEETLVVIRAAHRTSEWSDGAFDLSWAALREFYLFQPGEQRLPNLREIRAKLPLVNYRNVVIDETSRTVFLRREGMAIGTGAITKGYALDRAEAILKAHGFHNFMIFGGGQVQVAGKRGDRSWRVGIAHPRRQEPLAYFESTEGSIATAGDYEHAFVAEGKRWHHIIDPSSGLPVAHTVSVTILSEEGLYADALDTACFVMGPAKCLEMLAEIPVRSEAVIIDAEGRVITTPGTETRLKMTIELARGHVPGVGPEFP